MPNYSTVCRPLCPQLAYIIQKTKLKIVFQFNKINWNIAIDSNTIAIIRFLFIVTIKIKIKFKSINAHSIIIIFIVFPPVNVFGDVPKFTYF